MVLFSVSESFIDIVSINLIKATLVIHKGNMLSKSNLLKLLVIQVEIVGDLNGCKSD